MKPLWHMVSRLKWIPRSGEAERTNFSLLLNSQIRVHALEEAIENCNGGWAIDRYLGRALANAIVLHKPRSVLELGAGTSSVLLATALDAIGGGKLTSVEQDPSWCRDKWKQVEAFNTVNALMVPSTPTTTLGRMGLFAYHRYAKKFVESRAPYDMVLIDAPQYYLGREGAIPLIYEGLSIGALIFLDDAARDGERWALWKWLKTYPGLQLEYYDAGFGLKGLAILRKRKANPPRFSPICFGIGALQEYRRWQNRRVS
jgi:predicted O-methyltransferase YrrM